MDQSLTHTEPRTMILFQELGGQGQIEILMDHTDQTGITGSTEMIGMYSMIWGKFLKKVIQPVRKR